MSSKGVGSQSLDERDDTSIIPYILGTTYSVLVCCPLDRYVLTSYDSVTNPPHQQIETSSFRAVNGRPAGIPSSPSINIIYILYNIIPKSYVGVLIITTTTK